MDSQSTKTENQPVDIGIEGDGLYTVDRDPTDNDQPFEELIAASALRGFEAPALDSR